MVTGAPFPLPVPALLGSEKTFFIPRLPTRARSAQPPPTLLAESHKTENLYVHLWKCIAPATKMQCSRCGTIAVGRA
jgi:hypothetical protein